MNKKLMFILLVILAIGFIFFNSSKSGSESNYISKSLVSRFIANKETTEVFNDFRSDKSEYDLNNLYSKMNFIVRKLAHGTEYFILAFSLVMLFNNFNIRFREKFIYSLFIVLIIALLDEFYQMYVPDRSSLVSDIVIDFIGGILGSLISSLVIYIRRSFNKPYDSIH
ncbi:VanZ family protein [Clostridium disporicum]|uniref:Acetobutylicum phosphotransbutyrylase n=1 Tax=Clostridium disporicum TaxID=84024 RepID=A0A174FAW7_9CLOT|nr:VanZ family protein [Clostridium disporicum]CUO45799.1 acetobutylicum phosphotransbutyrylase [Clostridium disporicum]